MPHHGMTPHTSGTSLSAQARYASGVREILECFLDGTPIRDPYLIVQNGQLAGMGLTLTPRVPRPRAQKKRLITRSNFRFLPLFLF